jgi:DNA-binding GntR family transcriptional regulator
LCARRPDRGRFAELRSDFEAQRAALEAGDPPDGDYSQCYALIARLNEAIDEGARNPYLLSGLSGLRGHLERLRQIARRRPPRMLQSVTEPRPPPGRCADPPTPRTPEVES